MIDRKYLKDIGCTEECWPNTVYTKSDKEKDKRLDKYLKEEQETGVNPADTWNLDGSAMMWIYERLIVYKKISNCDLSFHKFIFDGEEKTQEQLIDRMIVLAEFLLGEPDNLKKDSETYNKLMSNECRIKYLAYDSGEEIIYKEDKTKLLPSIAAEDYRYECEKEFWRIWAEIFRAMWW